MTNAKIEKLQTELNELNQQKAGFDQELVNLKEFVSTHSPRYYSILADVELKKQISNEDRDFQENFETKEKRIKTVEKVIAGLENTIKKTDQRLVNENENHRNKIKAKCEKEIVGKVAAWNTKIDELQVLLDEIAILSNDYRLSLKDISASLLTKACERAFSGAGTFAKVKIDYPCNPWNSSIDGLKLELRPNIK